MKHAENITAKGKVKFGLDYVGWNHRKDITLINVKGKLNFNGNFSVGRGCRFDIGSNAFVSIGNGGYINSNTKLIIMHGLTIGNNCAISWDCQFLDDDFHEINYLNKEKVLQNEIIIGNNVWIGCGVKIYKGTIIPDGSVIASDSVVKGIFEKENSLIAGQPAKLIREKVKWE